MFLHLLDADGGHVWTEKIRNIRVVVISFMIVKDLIGNREWLHEKRKVYNNTKGLFVENTTPIIQSF